MRVVIINYEFPPIGGGAARAAQGLAASLRRLGDEVLVISARWGGLPHEETRAGYAIARVPSWRRRADRANVAEMASFTVGGLLRAPARTRAFAAEVAIVYFAIPCGPIGLWLERTQGLPYVLSLRGGDVPGFFGQGLGLYHRLLAPLERRIWRRAGHVVANGEGLATLAGRFLPDLPIAVIPNGVDSETFAPPPTPRARGGRRRILSVGRLAAQKGFDLLVEAAAALDGDTWELWIAGDGPDREAIARYAAGRGVTLRLLGFRSHEEMPELYRQADLFALASHDEGMPNVVLEAMATALPIVVTAVPGSRELIRDGVSGLVVPPGDAPALAAAIERLGDDEEAARGMGRQARERAQELSLEHTARAYQRLCRELRARRGAESGL